MEGYPKATLYSYTLMWGRKPSILPPTQNTGFKIQSHNKIPPWITTSCYTQSIAVKKCTVATFMIEFLLSVWPNTQCICEDVKQECFFNRVEETPKQNVSSTLEVRYQLIRRTARKCIAPLTFSMFAQYVLVDLTPASLIPLLKATILRLTKELAVASAYSTISF
jgi:hypothetical protein